jgi:membrane protease YdiL (CAAX protease family)
MASSGTDRVAVMPGSATGRPSTDRRDLVALSATLVAITAWNLGRSTVVPAHAGIPANLAVAAVSGGIAWLGGSVEMAWGAVVGTVAATTTAGVAFAWLRLRSGSLLAPILAHIATNSLAFSVAWAYWHR